MAKLIKSHNKNTDRRLALLVGILLFIMAGIACAVFGLWIISITLISLSIILTVLIRGRIKILSSGVSGENQTAKMLAKRLARTDIVCQNCTVKCGPTAEFDCIAITQKGVFAIEVKNQAGDITGDVNAPYWRHTRSGKGGKIIEKQMPNALMQSDRQVKVLQNVLNDCRIKAPVYGYVYFANSYINVKINSKYIFADDEKLLAYINKGRAVMPPKTVRIIADEIKHRSI